LLESPKTSYSGFDLTEVQSLSLEGRRQKTEGRRQKAEGRGQKGKKA